MTKLVKRAFKYRFYPTPQQEELLRQTFGCVRVVWNKALAERTTAWRTEKRSVSFAQTSTALTAWKKQEEYVWLNDVSAVPLQQTLRHLNDAFSRFWNKQNAYPNFKSRKSRQSATFAANAFRWDAVNQTLTLAKMDAPLDIRWSRPIPDGSVPSTVTVSLDRAGRWFVSLLTETAVEELAPTQAAVGIDLGLTHFAILSSGLKIENPRIAKKHHQKLAKAQRAAAKKQKGSNNRRKANLKVARISARIADGRKDFLHKLSTQLIRENQTVVLEDLNVKGMSAKAKKGRRKRGLNRSIRDASWAEFRSMLSYKAEWYGRELVVIDRWFPSSQMCSVCGTVDGKKPLDVREWVCRCGAVLDRDINAAKNILAAGQAVSVCGDNRRAVVKRKR